MSVVQWSVTLRFFSSWFLTRVAFAFQPLSMNIYIQCVVGWRWALLNGCTRQRNYRNCSLRSVWISNEMNRYILGLFNSSFSGWLTHNLHSLDGGGMTLGRSFDQEFEIKLNLNLMHQIRVIAWFWLAIFKTQLILVEFIHSNRMFIDRIKKKHAINLIVVAFIAKIDKS